MHSLIMVNTVLKVFGAKYVASFLDRLLINLCMAVTASAAYTIGVYTYYVLRSQ